MVQPPGYPPSYPPPYPQPPYGYGAPPMYYPRPTGPQRSAIPKVVGVIAIVFSVMGLLCSLVFALGPLSDLKEISRWSEDDVLGNLILWIQLWLGLSVLVFVPHLVGGILSIGYKPAGRAALNVYAVTAILLAIADVVLMFALEPGKSRWLRENTIYPRAGYEVLALVWPIVVLALINTRGARKAYAPAAAPAP